MKTFARGKSVGNGHIARDPPRGELCYNPPFSPTHHTTQRQMSPSSKHKNKATNSPRRQGVAWMVVPALVLSGIALLLGVVDFLCFNVFIPSYAKITLPALLAGIGAFISLSLFGIRLIQQDRRDIDERFHSAVALLGNDEASARTGAIYSLYYLAIESNKYREQAAQILCSHIRSKTEEDKYRERHPAQPSNEIQTAIDLLFKDYDKLEGLYPKFLGHLLPGSLARAYLVGANFSGAKCQGVDFFEAYCQGAFFGDAHCETAVFMDAQCQGVNFMNAHLQGAVFARAHCQSTYFKNAVCHGTCFDYVRCQGAHFENTQCQGAYALSGHRHISLRERINRETELKTMVISGPFDQNEIDAVKMAKDLKIDQWHDNMQDIITAHQALPATYSKEILPAGIITGKFQWLNIYSTY